MFKEYTIFEHELNWSPFEYGLTIDRSWHDSVFDYLGKHLGRGERVDVILLIDNEPFNASITNADRAVKGDTIRLLYTKDKSEIRQYLLDKYPEEHMYLERLKSTFGGRSYFELPDHLKKTMQFKATRIPNVIKVYISSVALT